MVFHVLGVTALVLLGGAALACLAIGAVATVCACGAALYEKFEAHFDYSSDEEDMF